MYKDYKLKENREIEQEEQIEVEMKRRGTYSL